jgi:hypothetical protein
MHGLCFLVLASGIASAAAEQNATCLTECTAANCTGCLASNSLCYPGLDQATCYAHEWCWCPETPSDVLLQGQSLHTSDVLYSANKMFGIQDQGDGNVVVYCYQEGYGYRKGIWSTGVPAGAPPTHLELSNAGEVINYRNDNGSVTWRSGVTGQGSKFWARMQGNGNFVVHQGECCDNNTQVIWSTNSYHEGWCHKPA